jgi:hypothetical protein
VKKLLSGVGAGFGVPSQCIKMDTASSYVYHDGVSEAQKGLVQEFEIDHGIRSSRA